MTAPQTAINPTWTWGSSALIDLSGNQFSNSAQLAQVTLPEPAVCSIYLQATVQLADPSKAYVGTFTINLSQGLGRVTVPRQVSFASQPGPSSPVEWTFPFIPLHALQVDVSANLIGQIQEGQQNSIQVYLVLAPITRIPQKVQQLKFGMALPGEADALDDELRTDLEDETPTAQQIMGLEADERAHGREEPETAPAWMLDLVDRLSARLRRAPTRQELRAAIARHQARTARRAR